MDQRLFIYLAGLVTHATIDLISREPEFTKKWAEEVNQGLNEHELPQGEEHIRNCDFPV